MRGLFFLLFLVLLIVVPLFAMRGSGHPLAAQEAIDACALMRATPAFATKMPAGTVYEPEKGEGFAGACRASWGTPSWVALRVLTTRKATAMQGGGLALPEKAYEIWVSESRASGATVAEAKGPWRSAVTIEYGPNAPMRVVLAEDDGVMASIEAAGDERARVVPLAAALVEGMRVEQ